MSLASYKPPILNFPIGDQAVVIRGLSLTDLSMLINSNLEDMEVAFSLVSGILNDIKSTDEAVQASINSRIQSAVVTLARSAPRLCTAAIAMCAVEDSEFEDRLAAAATLSAPIQVDLMLAIGKMTFEEVGGVKKFIEKLGALLSQMKLTPEQSPTPSLKGKKKAP